MLGTAAARAGRTAGLLALALVATAAAQEVGEGSGVEAVASVQAMVGLVEVQRGGEWFELEDGDELARDDVVRTDVDAFARLEFLDAAETGSGEPTVVDLDAETEVHISDLEVDHAAGHRTGFLDLVRGALQAVVKGWQNGSVFSVRAGTTICGVRGSVANVGFDPASEDSTVTSIEGDIVTFEARDRAEALAAHREAARSWRRRERVAFARALEAGHKLRRPRGGRAMRSRLDPQTLRQVREAVRKGRGRGQHGHSRRFLNHFAKVRPTGRKARARQGRSLRQALAKRPQLRAWRRKGGPGRRGAEASAFMSREALVSPARALPASARTLPSRRPAAANAKAKARELAKEALRRKAARKGQAGANRARPGGRGRNRLKGGVKQRLKNRRKKNRR